MDMSMESYNVDPSKVYLWMKDKYTGATTAMIPIDKEELVNKIHFI